MTLTLAGQLLAERGRGMLLEFFNDGLQKGQRTDSRSRRDVRGPHRATEAGQQESGLNRFKGNAAFKSDASLALVYKRFAGMACCSLAEYLQRAGVRRVPTKASNPGEHHKRDTALLSNFGRPNR